MTCHLSFPRGKSWFPVTRPLLRRIQPCPFTSLLQEVFIPVKWSMPGHQRVSQENAPSVAFFCDQTTPVCLEALSHLERPGFALLQAGAGWRWQKAPPALGRAGGPGCFPRHDAFHTKTHRLPGEGGFAAASLLCVGEGGGCGGICQALLWCGARVKCSQPPVPA